MEECDIFEPPFIISNDSSPFLAAIVSASEAYSPVQPYVDLTLCTAGIITNLVNIIVLSKPSMRSSVNAMLTSIAMVDILTMCSMLIYTLHFIDYRACDDTLFTFPWMIFVLVHMITTITLHSSSLWLACAMAIMRHVHLRQTSIISRKDTSTRFAWLISGVVILLAFLASAPSIFIHQIVPYDSYYDMCSANGSIDNQTQRIAYTVSISAEAFKNHCFGFSAVLWTNGICFKIAPCVCLAVVLSSLLSTMRSAKRRQLRLLSVGRPSCRPSLPGLPSKRSSNTRIHQSDSASIMLVSVLVLCFVTELPQGIIAVLGGIYPSAIHGNVYPHVGDFMDLLSLIGSNVNFFLYCIMSSKFRSTFSAVVCPWRPRCLPIVRPLSTMILPQTVVAPDERLTDSVQMATKIITTVTNQQPPEPTECSPVERQYSEDTELFIPKDTDEEIWV